MNGVCLQQFRFLFKPAQMLLYSTLFHKNKSRKTRYLLCCRWNGLHPPSPSANTILMAPSLSSLLVFLFCMWQIGALPRVASMVGEGVVPFCTSSMPICCCVLYVNKKICTYLLSLLRCSCKAGTEKKIFFIKTKKNVFAVG